MSRQSDTSQIRAQTARETLEIIDKGGYYNDHKEWVGLGSSIDHCVKNTRLYSPEDFSKIKDYASQKLASRKSASNASEISQLKDRVLEIALESTLAAANRLLQLGYHPVCLNFASAKNPGGGFLKGSGAQEESLSRASALYASISRQKEYYRQNKQYSSALYTDHMIYSPQVPVFRDDQDRLLKKPYQVAFITAPAVNAGVVRSKEPDNIHLIEETMVERIQKIICLAVYHGHSAIVLGAFGCGVFKNDPEKVAEYFHRCLFDVDEVGELGYLFDKIVFAILARSKNSPYTTFKRSLIADQAY
ncbi:TIGR02452 family protein [Natranaerobius thermophilus]|uniref:Microbial-type PARG catalytic domain-containing protein n=1 Tax=Natranaerobius thermophilus (strain ATCC BAA-1301 / DSM 18059 / JW/NM-WN-LF) TaxID=457570 RepID=B2A6S5_NATTJ|nr:TIGR02452 family protein [Natranaerobius thermophilus]ACB84206.1 conserved hypothetical protein [Natranaerobius thermophilus JW/NM-WN-LF]